MEVEPESFTVLAVLNVEEEIDISALITPLILEVHLSSKVFEIDIWEER